MVDDRIFVSGTVGYDFRTGALPETAEGQTEQALNTIAWSLKEAGSCLGDIVRVRVYVPNPEDVVAVSTTLKQTAWQYLSRQHHDLRAARGAGMQGRDRGRGNTRLCCDMSSSHRSNGSRLLMGLSYVG